MSIDLRDQLRQKYGSAAAVAVSTPVQTATGGIGHYLSEMTRLGKEVGKERAFVVHAASGRTVITTPVREIARVNAGFTYLRGRFVEADRANLNGAMWTTEDLQIGGATIAGGPLNWLHDERQIIGALLQGEMVEGREEARIGNHIVADAAVWKFLFPRQADTIERAAADRQLYYSMECISREVACVDSPNRPGCGESFSYGDYDAGKCCHHLRERSSIRRFVDPIFLGGAVIVPPVLPGWANAEAEVLRQAAALSEGQHIGAGDLTEAQARDLATAVLSWANRTSE